MYKKKEPLIIILSGKARTGKNMIANVIEEYIGKEKCIQVSYAYHLKDCLKRMNKYSEKEKDKYRTLLQEFGIDFLGKEIDSKFLINRTIEDINIFSYFYETIIITDARFIDEIEIPKQHFKNVITINVTSKCINGLTKQEKHHITETALDNYVDYDYKIENNGTKEELKKRIVEILEGIR